MRKEIRKEYNFNLLPSTNIMTGKITMAGLTIDMKKRKYNSGNNN